jgi:hypothetical protein
MVGTPLGILISSFDFSPVAEDEFHDWYDTEHIPERERVPGFLLCRRWMSIDDPKVSMTTYDLASVAVFRSPGYLAIGYENNSPWTRRVGWNCIKRLRFEGEQILPGDRLPPADAGGLVVYAANVAEDFEPEFNRWYDEEHIPLLSRVPGVLCARRFRATASTHRYVAVYHLESPEVAASAPWQAALATDWTRRVEPHLRDESLTVCRRYVRSTAA